MKKLAILGASYLQKPLFLKAKEMGIETYCFAWDNEFAVCKEIADYFFPISVLEKEEILVKCQEYDIDGITTIATDICLPTISFICGKMGLTGNPLSVVNDICDKYRMRELTQSCSFNSPKFFSFDSTFKLEKDFSVSFPAIIKPVDRSGSLGVTKVERIEDLKLAMDSALEYSLSSRGIIEEYIEGREISVETISYKGNHEVLTITDKVTSGEPHFVELEQHQPSSLKKEVQEKIKGYSIELLEKTGVVHGAGHIEFKVNDQNDVYLIEVGARMGGDFIGSDLVELSTGVDFLKSVIEIAFDEYTGVKYRGTQKYSGIYYLSKNTQHILSYFEDENDFEKKKELFNTNLKYVSCSNDRSGYLIYQADEKVIL